MRTTWQYRTVNQQFNVARSTDRPKHFGITQSILPSSRIPSHRVMAIDLQSLNFFVRKLEVEDVFVLGDTRWCDGLWKRYKTLGTLSQLDLLATVKRS